MKLLKDGDADIRHGAACALAAGGHREAIPVLLEGEADLFLLNAVRQPEEWRRLAGRELANDLEPASANLQESVAGNGSFQWDFAALDPLESEMWLSDDSIDKSSLLAVLENIAASSAMDMVVEPGRIAVLPRDKAVEFWKAWWEAERKK
jgi:hypothetical protein